MQDQQKFVPPYPIGIRVAIETAIGYLAGFSISPLITIVDKAIVQNSSGQSTIGKSMIASSKALTTQPIQFIKRPEQLWIFAVYSNTYTCQNLVDSVCKNYGIPEEAPKFWITFLVNMSLSIAKDRALVRLFGTIAPQAVPKWSYFFWGLRDGATVMAAFIIPKRATNYLVQNHGYDRSKTMTTVTFWCPILLQFFSTPLHLLGLDHYNNRNSSLTQRLNVIRKSYIQATLARMARMTPAYGIGGVLNLKLRQHFFGNLEARRL